MKKTPKTGTIAARDFFESWHEINRFFNFLLFLVEGAEKVASTAHEVLVKTARNDEERKKLERQWENRKGKGSFDELKKNRQLFLEMILVRHIENFLNYLSSLLYEIFIAKPETLKSSDTVEISKVLDHDTIDSLVLALAEIKVASLSYTSFQNLASFFLDRFKLTIATEEELKKLALYCEIRNISVHNRCIVNERFTTKVDVDKKLIGTKRDLYISDLDDLVPLLLKTVISIDKNARRKMKVKGVRFGNS